MVAAGGWRGEVEDVAQGDAEVLEKLPGGVGEVGRDGAAEFGGEIFDGIVEGGVSLAALKEIDQLFAQRRVVVCSRVPGFVCCPGCAHRRFPLRCFYQLDATQT
jgi:hypothetical protein